MEVVILLAKGALDERENKNHDYAGSSERWAKEAADKILTEFFPEPPEPVEEGERDY